MLDIISVIVSIVCAGGSFISFLLAQKEKREAKGKSNDNICKYIYVFK